MKRIEADGRWRGLLIFVAVVTCIAGCDLKEVRKMNKLADEICECKTVVCAVDVRQRISKLYQEVEDTRVRYSQAQKFKTDLRRAIDCYTRISGKQWPVSYP